MIRTEFSIIFFTAEGNDFLVNLSFDVDRHKRIIGRKTKTREQLQKITNDHTHYANMNPPFLLNLLRMIGL